MLDREERKALRAPVIIVVVTRIRANANIPNVEQIVSAGAAAEHIMLAVQALGYGAMWRTGAPAYDDRVKEGLGIGTRDAIIGMIYIGTPAAAQQESSALHLGDFVTRWQGEY